MRADFSYHCSDCGEILTHVTQGACPICGSHSVLPLGWFQISTRERNDWLQRIRGLRRKPRVQSDQAPRENEPDVARK